MVKKVILILILLISSLISSLRANISSKEPIKIACVGNSITYGYKVVNRSKNAFPSQLQALLGNRYQVKNFGVSGRTLLKKGDYPYWKTAAYKNALQFKPDIVYIKLGTNDSKLQNRIYLSEFEANYNELISNFKEQNNKIRIVILLPIPSFLKDSTSIWNPIIKKKIIPKLQNIAYNNNVELLDLYHLFIDKEILLPDYIHPSALGATIIAKRLYENVLFNKGSKINNFRSNPQGIKKEISIGKLNSLVRLNFKDKSIKTTKESNFYGYKLTDFNFKDWNCKIVEPKIVAKGNPWVLRARFWGHEPQTDIALLERGFHISYCDVSDLYGGDEAVKRWNAFYQFMIKKGLSKKVVLEGMSRGGLIIYNWALKNLTKIACIYADAPVLDGKSWPGGIGKGKGYPEGWIVFKEIYNLKSNESIANFSNNPIYKTTEIAGGGFPMLHVCGEADKVVPVDENTRIFEKKIKEARGNITVIYKKNGNHHPHSLKNPTPIVNFILRATGYKTNFATIYSPGSEYRSAAGWKKGKEWWAQMKDIDSLCKNSGKIDLLLVGNSITQGWGGKRTLTTYKPGQKATDTFFSNLKWINAGISGDRTQHTAWRIKNGHYNTCSPDFVCLAIGVNNFNDNTAEEIAKGIALNIKMIEEKIPHAKILFYGPLPTGLDKSSDRRKKYNKIHRLISYLGKRKSVYYYNMLEAFSNKKGMLKESYYSKDGIHLKPEGYTVWAKQIKEQIETIKHSPEKEFSWEELSEHYKFPKWYTEARFGIWVHWGAQVQPLQGGGWYARHMYMKDVGKEHWGKNAYSYHNKTYGHPSNIGYKDVIHQWKAENLNTDALLKYFKNIGAKYFVALANHHDHFDNFNSTYHPWNSVKVGPKRDIIGEFEKSSRKYNIPFGVSSHDDRFLHWWLPAFGTDTSGSLKGIPYDGYMTKKDGIGKWWEGLDPADLYGLPPEKRTPEWIERVKNNWKLRHTELVTKYNPDMVWFDGWGFPYKEYGKEVCQTFFNNSLKRHGKIEAVIVGKFHNEPATVKDIERGGAKEILSYPWQGITTFRTWFYKEDPERIKYKHNIRTIIELLSDYISKNGNLLLNVELLPDGTIPPKQKNMLDNIGTWINTNSKAIYASKPWKVYGDNLNSYLGNGNSNLSETDLEALKKEKKNEQFNERTLESPPYGHHEVRFTTKGNILYIFVLNPTKGKIKLSSLGFNSPYKVKKISSIKMLGKNKGIKFKQNTNELEFSVPRNRPHKYTAVFEVKGAL